MILPQTAPHCWSDKYLAAQCWASKTRILLPGPTIITSKSIYDNTLSRRCTYTLLDITDPVWYVVDINDAVHILFFLSVHFAGLTALQWQLRCRQFCETLGDPSDERAIQKRFLRSLTLEISLLPSRKEMPVQQMLFTPNGRP